MRKTGIWIAKYEMSMETNKTASNGDNRLADSTYNSLSKPVVVLWGGISVGNYFVKIF